MYKKYDSIFFTVWSQKCTLYIQKHIIKEDAAMCETLTGLDVLSCVTHGSQTLPDLKAEKLAALFSA